MNELFKEICKDFLLHKFFKNPSLNIILKSLMMSLLIIIADCVINQEYTFKMVYLKIYLAITIIWLLFYAIYHFIYRR